jgi:DNA-binding transcriptional ArsR family regulator
MSHPLRAKILLLLAERSVASPKELAVAVGMSREKVPNVSHHVKRLVELDCAELVEERPVRGAVEHFYRATQRHLIASEEWETLDPIAKTDLLCDFVQPGLDDFVASVRAGLVGSDEEFHLTRFRMVIDREAKLKILEIQERARLEIEEAHEESANRIAASEEETIRFTSWLGGFEVPPVAGLD